MQRREQSARDFILAGKSKTLPRGFRVFHPAVSFYLRLIPHDMSWTK